MHHSHAIRKFLVDRFDARHALGRPVLKRTSIAAAGIPIGFPKRREVL